ncbi:MAG: hypothetical protein QM817_33200 [Archangium sp.]
MTFPTLSAEYDEGYFDKDEQGWVANRTSVVSRSDGTVKVRQWGDSNGRDPYDRTYETRIVQVFEALKLVKLEHSGWYFDLAADRLISATKTEYLVRRPAIGEWWSTSRIARSIDSLCLVANVLGAPVVNAPPFGGLAQRGVGVDRYTFTFQEFSLPHAARLTLTWRPPIGAEYVTELGLLLAVRELAIGLTVSEKGELFVSANGPFELRAAAREAAATAEW